MMLVGTIFGDIALFDLISLLFSDRESCDGAARWNASYDFNCVNSPEESMTQW